MKEDHFTELQKILEKAYDKLSITHLLVLSDQLDNVIMKRHAHWNTGAKIRHGHWDTSKCTK